MKDFRPGDKVAYRPYPEARPEYGTVKRVSNAYVFVIFEGEWQAKACSRRTLEPAPYR